MKRVLFFAITLAVAFAPGCKDDRVPLTPPLEIKINITYEAPNITIDVPDPDPAKIAKGDTVNWVVTVKGRGSLDVTIDDFADNSGKPVDVFGDGSVYKFGGVGSAPVGKPTKPADVVSGPEGFKYRITAVSPTGHKNELDPRIIVSAGLAK